MESHMAARARLMPAPDVEPPDVEPPDVEPPDVDAAERFGAGAGAGRFFVPTRTTALTGFFVTTEEISLVETTLPSLRVRRSVMVRMPATPLVATFFWSV